VGGLSSTEAAETPVIPKLRACLRSSVSAVRVARWVGCEYWPDGYPSDLPDEQWALMEPLLPAPRTGRKGGRRTSPVAGWGAATSRRARTSGPPWRSVWTARMVRRDSRGAGP
jgi:hypothetical protein